MGISFHSVRKSYGGETAAVEDFSLELASNSITVLVGSSGSGKTTLLRMVNRMIDPDSGFVEIDGVRVTDKNPVKLRRSIGYVMQNGGLLPHRTVLENITTVARLNELPLKQANAKAFEIMDLVGLDREFANRYPAQLSGGQRQRVGVARALMVDSDLLLMDEPFGAVDPIVRKELQLQLKQIQQDLKKTVLFVTHDIDEALFLADQIVILGEGGKILQSGTPEQLMANPDSEFIASFIGADKAGRILEVREIGDESLVVDADGSVIGKLAD